MKIIFDIETGSYSEETLFAIMPEFSAAANVKDPAKIAAQIAEKQAEFISGAALSATTSRVLAIGFKVEDGDTQILTNDSDDDEGEIEILESFIGFVGTIKPYQLVGHNVKGFDIPYIIRRCWLHGISVPVFAWTKKYSDTVIDTYEVWSAGQWQAKGKLNEIAKFFGFEEKTGTGDQFAQWFRGGEKERAIEYLQRDIELAENVARKMGVM